MQVPLKANQELVQKTNQIWVLRLIRSVGPISRAELAKRMDLSPSAVTNLTASLLERSLIREIYHKLHGLSIVLF